jgi:hypothetical protein
MSRYILFALALSIIGNAALGWAAVHEHTQAKTAELRSQVRLRVAQNVADATARAEQHAADQATLKAAQELSQRASDVVAQAKLQIGTVREQGREGQKVILEVIHDAKPTDCARQRLPDRVRRVYVSGDSAPG